MIRSLGLAWTFRVLGIIALLVNAISTALINDRNAVIGSSQIAFDTKLLRRVEFLLLLGFGCFSIFGYVILNFSLADYATKVGLSTSQSVLVGSLFSLGQAIGRPLLGYFSDRTGRINMSTVSTMLAGIFCLVVWVQAKTYGVLILFSIISGCVAGTFWTTIGPVATEVVGLRTIPSALCMIWLVIVPAALFSEPIALQIVAGTGSYFGAQVFAGLTYIMAGLCLLVLRGWKISETDEITRILGVDARQIDRANMEMNEELSGRGSRVGRKMMMTTWWKVRKV
ncbi:hypothetical protein NQ176_g1384 [Zarea fungicola]|uniref:Uncharacterized protein n=1 Tax=Zarea fungicola TaxID=93591 RepID=A0ACC1NUG2_9HYPO|nr:hypothetical protein NQ176_g1384 [Lecanicillium fungicola]